MKFGFHSMKIAMAKFLQPEIYESGALLNVDIHSIIYTSTTHNVGLFH